MILTTPAFSAIKRRYPDCELHVLCSTINSAVIKNNPFVDKILTYEKKPISSFKLILKLRNEYDIYFDPKDHYSTESALFAKLSKSNKKVGFKKDKSSPFNIGVDQHLKKIHFSDLIKSQLKHIDVEIANDHPKPELFTTDASDNYVDGFLSGIDGKKVIINISASKENKMWPNERWIEFINSNKENDVHFILSYAPPEKERAEKILFACNDLIEFRSRTLNDVISLVRRSDCVISIDTALVHIAAAFNTPIVTLFGGPEKEYVKWKALSDIEHTIKSDGKKVISIDVDTLNKVWNDFKNKI